MIRTLNVILFFTSVLALAGVYVLKYQTETIADEKVAIQRDIAQQNTNLSVLRADWAYLSQPSHIEPIVIRHEDSLELKVISAKQYGSITDIPMRPQQVNDEALTRLLEALDAGVDPIGDKLNELIVQ
ncbi:MAG: hypothetical protein KDJ19_14985 [Hyphomicrobiaceae bacterium]|nr:hypothetical protein [Hyphomicrobiaceae bacterium]MCC0024889.1 hypothetical protein [Hyphomicrobiaceae bacterium]